MSAIVKIDHMIDPATSFAEKVTQATGDRDLAITESSSRTITKDSLLDKFRYVYSVDVSCPGAGPGTIVLVRRVGISAMPVLEMRLNEEGRASWQSTTWWTEVALPHGARLVANPASMIYVMRVATKWRRYMVSVSATADENEDNDIYARLEG